MAIQDRIEKIKAFFKGFNVDAEQGVSVLLVRFPNGWQIPNQENLSKKFSIQIAARQEGYYFVSEIENGIDGLFDAADYTIEYNQSIIEKSEILKEKINELKELFINESIERLKTLEFTFGGEKITPKKNVKSGKKSTASAEKKKPQVIEEKAAEIPLEDEQPENNDDDNDLMSLAKSELGE